MVFVIAVLLWGALPAPAGAGHNFGHHYINDGCCSASLFGTRASMNAPAEGFNITAGQGGFERVAVEKYRSDGIGLMQIGFVAAAEPVDDCGRAYSLSNWFEWKAIGGVYRCLYFAGLVKGETKLYSVLRRPPSAVGGSTTEWGVFYQGTIQFSIDLGFNYASRVLAGGEIATCDPGCSDPHSSYLNGCYGCGTGDINWQRAQNPGGDWYTIQEAYTRNDYSEWIIGDIPGGFRVRHDPS